MTVDWEVDVWTWRRFCGRALALGIAVTSGFTVVILVITRDPFTSLMMFIFPNALMVLVILAASRIDWKARLGSWVELKYRAWAEEVCQVLERYLEDQGVEWILGKDEMKRPTNPPPYILQGKDIEVVIRSDGMTTWMAIGPVPERGDVFRSMVEDIDTMMVRELPAIKKARRSGLG